MLRAYLDPRGAVQGDAKYLAGQDDSRSIRRDQLWETIKRITGKDPEQYLVDRSKDPYADLGENYSDLSYAKQEPLSPWEEMLIGKTGKK
ncbi:MAG: hypothetical protein V2A79_15535 [Planctomycetota bacterium]